MLASPIQIGLLGLLASPGSSIFLYSPLLLMLPWSFPALWRRARPESLTILAIVVCSLLLASRFILWHGL